MGINEWLHKAAHALSAAQMSAQQRHAHKVGEVQKRLPPRTVYLMK
jgi:hypothetical protein